METRVKIILDNLRNLTIILNSIKNYLYLNDIENAILDINVSRAKQLEKKLDEHIRQIQFFEEWGFYEKEIKINSKDFDDIVFYLKYNLDQMSDEQIKIYLETDRHELTELLKNITPM